MISGRNTGRLDVRLTIQKITNFARNSVNEPQYTWGQAGTLYAERNWKPSGEKFEGVELIANDIVEFKARYCAWITPRMRFNIDKETSFYYVTNVRTSRREDITIIDAERRDNQGENADFSVTDNTMDSTMQG